MLQRAASNAYSWWWASHIRTKQSKWLEQNLQDMEEKVEGMLKLISEDGDSFAKRAEMYYKRRPELINFVEESFRAYRSLAERYDHISTELQNANNTIATYLPDQVKFDMDDEDDDDVSPRSRRRKKMPPQFPRPSPSDNNVGIPNVPKAPLKNLKTIISTSACAKKFRPKKESEAAAAYKKACAAASAQSSKSSGLTKPQALQKIDKLQKDILGLQTVKEFVKSSYEGGLAKYWEIEDQITGMQAEVSSLQDEFNETVVIEDDEARSLMTSTAIKSCQEKLASLQQKHHKSVQSAKIERWRVKELRDKFNALMNKEHNALMNKKQVIYTKTKLEEEEEDEEEAAAYALEEKIKQHYIDQVESSTSSSSSLTVDEMTEKIDELVNKVINLETDVSSQDALIMRLKNEADDLQSKIQVVEKLEDESTKLKEMKKMEEKLEGVEKLSVDVKKQNVNVHTHITEAKYNVQHLCQVHCIIKSDDVNLNMEQQQEQQKEQREEMTKVLPNKKREEDMSTVVLPNKKREEEMPTVLPNNKREEEMTVALPNKKRDEEMTMALPNKKREADEVVDNENSNIVSEKVKKNKELDNSENVGGSLLSKKSDVVVDQIVDKDSMREDEEKMNKDLDLDSNNKKGMEPKSTSSSSSPRKKRSESSGGGGLLSGAKKLMGFKVAPVREEANSSAVSTSIDSVANQNKDNTIINDKKKQQEQEEENENEKEKEKEEPNHVVEDRRITGSRTDSSTSTLSVEKEEEENKKKTTNAPTEAAAATAQSNYDAQSKNTTPHLQHQEELICDVKNNEVIQLEKTNLVDVAAAATEQSNYDAQSKNTTPHLQHQEELIGDVKNSVPDELTHLEKPPQHQQNLKQQDDNGKQQASSFSKGNEKTSEYATTLRNYKDMKKKVSEENKISELQQLDVVLAAQTSTTEDTSSCNADLDEQLRALKTANALKDEEIRSLRQKLEHLQTVLGQPKVIIVKENFRAPSSSSSSRKATEEEEEENDDYDMKGLMMSMNMGGGEEQVVSEVEEKLRMEIDQVLEVNLDFWLRFSEALNQIQKYESVVEDLRREISKLEEKANKQKQQKEQQEGSSHRSSTSSRTLNDLKSDLKPIYKHLSEIQTELTVWMDKCVMLKEEQQSRFSSLCDIQEEITQAVKASAEDEDFRFTSYQAAKFQGEILNMKQENNKVANELQAGLDHITILQLDVDKTLGRLNDDYEFSGPTQQQPSSLTHSPSRNRVPLRSFIFGVKQKKKPSIFTCMTPAMHRKYNGLRVGF